MALNEGREHWRCQMPYRGRGGCSAWRLLEALFGHEMAGTSDDLNGRQRAALPGCRQTAQR